MARWANDLVMDAALDYIEDTEDICVCEGQPTDFTEATSRVIFVGPRSMYRKG